MIKEGLASKIFSLSKTILNDLKKIEINNIPRLYVKLKVNDTDNSTRQESFVKEELSLKDVFEFIESIKKNPEYSDVVSCISKNYNFNNNKASNMLNNLIRNILFDMTSRRGWNYRNDITDGFLIECIATFIGDLEGNPPTWNVTLWIEGISHKGQECKISNNLLIREVKISDLELEVPFDEVLLSVVYPSGYLDIPNRSSAVLEFKYKGHMKEVKSEVDIILTSLMLLRLGSIYSKRTEYNPNSFVAHQSTSWSTTSYSSNYNYNLKENDNLYILEIITILRNQWPLISIESNPIHIALERYSHALLKQESIEGRITSAINCLEALYLKKDERAELSHRLGQRVSAILRILGFVPIECYNNLVRAYDIRSNYIHGQIEPEKHKDAPKLGEKVLEYARLSMIVFIQLISDNSKEELINKIDNSLLDSNAFKKLNDIIKNQCKYYI
ncbi:MAG: hypothetical protein WCW68_03690 [Methanothrix sp.]